MFDKPIREIKELQIGAEIGLRNPLLVHGLRAEGHAFKIIDKTEKECTIKDLVTEEIYKILGNTMVQELELVENR